MNPPSGFIRFWQVSKSYKSSSGRFEALKNIDLTIGQGEYLAVVGKSGSGKSTWLNMLTGIDRPSRGMVSLGSIDVHALNESRLARWRGKNIGIVFQFFQLIPTLTTLENLLLPMAFAGVIPPRSRRERAGALLRQVGIADQGHKLPSGLSGGEQQRAAIARALANDPPIVVADEPTGNLDSKASETVHKLFAQLVKAGKTVIVVTHEDVSDSDYHRVITLNDGQVASDKRRRGKTVEIS